MRPIPVREFRHSHPHPVGEALPRSTDGQPPTLAPSASAAPCQAWQRALATGETRELLTLSGYHLAQFPRLAPAFTDLMRELRFCDLGENAVAAFIREILMALAEHGAVAAREHCLRATGQLKDLYERRNRPFDTQEIRDAQARFDDPVSDAEMGAIDDRHKWSA